MPKSEKRKRIEALLQAGEKVSDIARAESGSRQWVGEVKGLMERPRPSQGGKHRMSHAYREWLKSQQANEANDPFVNVLIAYGAPVTREEYLNTAWAGKPPDPLGAELESMLPEELQENRGESGTQED